MDLREQLTHRLRVRRGAERRRCAERNHEGTPTLARSSAAAASIAAVRSASRGNVANLGAQQLVQQRVGRRTCRRCPVRHQNAAHAEPRGNGGRRAGVIRLHAAARDQRVGPLGARARRNELQLADLVAAESKRNRIVALRQERRRAAQGGAQPRQLVDGSGTAPEGDARQRFETRENCTVGRNEGSSEPLV